MPPATAARSAPVPTPIYRKQTPVVYPGSGNNQPVKLYKTLVYRELNVELVCSPTLTAANNTAANTGMGDEWAVLKQLQLTVNGSDQLRTFSGDDLWWLNYFWYGQPPKTTATLADGATANPAIDSTLIVPFWMPRAFHPFDSLVDSGRFNDVQLSATFGNYTDINSAATGWTTQPTLNLLSHEQVLPADPNDQPKINWVIKKLVNTPAGANGSYPVPLDSGVSYRGFIINIKTAAGTADVTNPATFVSNVKVVGAGGRVYYDAPWQDLVSYQRSRMGLPQTVARRGASSNDQAWGYIDLCQDGRLTEALPNPADAHLEFNVLQSCQINVLVNQIFPIA